MEVMMKPPRGMHDFLPEEMWQRRFVMRVLENTCERFGYRPVLTPTIEYLEVHTRQTRAGTNQLYTLQDKKGRELVLRPDLNTVMSRLIANHYAAGPFPLRLYSCAPLFRYRRPQRYSYRELWQFGVHLYGCSSLAADVEILQVATECLRQLGIREFILTLSSLNLVSGVCSALGCYSDKLPSLMFEIRYADRGTIPDVLAKYGISEGKQLLDLLQVRGTPEHVLAFLDTLHCNNTRFTAARIELANFVRALAQQGISVDTVDLGNLHGTGYYSGLTWKIRTPYLERNLGGGGRFDELGTTLLTKELPATGVGFSLDRLVIVSERLGTTPPSHHPRILVVNQDDSLNALCISLRQAGFNVEQSLGALRPREAFRHAKRCGADWVISSGGQNTVLLRDLHSGEHRIVAISAVLSHIRSRSAATNAMSE